MIKNQSQELRKTNKTFELRKNKEIFETNLDAALTTWAKHCQLYGWRYQQPSGCLSDQDPEGNIVLNDGDGFVAKYSVQQKRILFAGNP